MCGRTSLFAPVEDLVERFEATPDHDHRPRYNIAPGDDLTTLANDDLDTLTRMEWGLVPTWADDPASGPRPINARSETVTEKPLFREPFEDRRCLVIADGFYEWAGQRGTKQPYRVHLADDRPFAMAGLWNPHPDGRGRTVTILTCDPSPVVADIHDRMPVVLAPADEATYLGGDVETAVELLDPYGDADLLKYPITTAVNDPSNDSPSILEPADRPEQLDLDSFGG